MVLRLQAPFPMAVLVSIPRLAELSRSQLFLPLRLKVVAVVELLVDWAVVVLRLRMWADQQQPTMADRLWRILEVVAVAVLVLQD